MQNNSKQQRTEHFNFMAALADSWLEAPQEEIEELIEEEGDNSEEIREVFRNAVRSARRQLLSESRELYEERVCSFKKTSFELPTTAPDKRSLIQSILGQMSQGQHALTAQFRDFENLPDEDLDGVLKQLIELQSDEQTKDPS